MILFVALHILVCCFLILVVLLQSGKAGDLASTFGGGGSQTAFGTRSATSLLTRFTALGAALFMVTCLILAGWAKRGESTVMTDTPTSTAPAEATGVEEQAPSEQPQTVPEATPPPAEESSGEGGEDSTGSN